MEEEEEDLDIFALDTVTDKKYLIQVSENTKAARLKEKLIKILNTNNFEIRFKSNLYEGNQILKFEDGDTVYIYPKEENKPLNINQIKIENKEFNLSGILKFLLIKYFADRVSDLAKITNPTQKNMILELKTYFELKVDGYKNIEINIKGIKQLNIISYSNLISSEIKDEEINNLINSLDETTKKEIKSFGDILSNYQKYNSFLEKDLFNSLKNSYFEYSLSGLKLLPLSNESNYLEESKKCSNKTIKYLYREYREEIKKETEIIYSNRNLIENDDFYFTDQLDYIAYKTGNDDMNSFSCNVSQIYYDNNKKNDFIKSSGYIPEKNSIFFFRTEPDSELLIKENKGKFIANKYKIPGKEQILPLFDLEFKRNKSLVIWTDPIINKNKNETNFYQLCKMLIYRYHEMNLYYEDSIEKALEIIIKKKNNKIILISNTGNDLNGKRFIEIARNILGFQIICLFFPVDINSVFTNWIKDLQNVLFANDLDFFDKYISNYKKKNLIKLKEKLEKKYNMSISFTNNYLYSPKYIDKKKFNNIIFKQIYPNFKKVIIRSNNSNVLCMDEKGNIIFVPEANITNYSYIWYITIINNKITFFMNKFYLGIDFEKNTVTKDEYMKIWTFEKIKDNLYLIYYENKKFILTDNNNNKNLIQDEKKGDPEQLFCLNEKVEDN